MTEDTTLTDETREHVKNIMFGVTKCSELINENLVYIEYSFSPDTFTNERPQSIGQMYEAEVREILRNTNSYQVYKCGLLCNKYIPYICTQPDGIIVDNDGIVALHEIKSVSGVDYFNELCRNPITCDEYGILRIHEKSKAYLQIQLSLFISGLDRCLLSLYLPHGRYDKLRNIMVYKDLRYLEREVSRITHSFEKHVIPILQRKPKLGRGKLFKVE